MRVYTASQVASCIGKNPYENLCDVFERRWKLEDKEGYLKAVRIIKPPSSFQKDQNDLYKALRTDVGKKITDIQNDDNTDITAKVTNIQGCDTSTLLDNEAVQLKKYTTSRAATKYGTKTESSAIEVYEAKTGNEVSMKNTTCKSRTVGDIMIRGKIDGMTADDKILEIKNRTKRLFGEVRLYEYIQVQCYLFIYDMQCADLAENFKSEMNIFAIERDDDFISEVFRKLCAFDKALTDVLSEDTNKEEYFSSIDRNAYISTLF